MLQRMCFLNGFRSLRLIPHACLHFRARERVTKMELELIIIADKFSFEHEEKYMVLIYET